MPRTNLSSQFDAIQRKEWAPKIVKRNTFKFQRDGETVIRLHGTDIVTKHADGSVTLNSAGWKTVTTKDRMNDHMPGDARLQQESGAWFISHGWQRDGRVPYFDGIRVPQCFDKPNAKGAATEKKEKALRASIRKFVGKCDKLTELPAPSQGDCWYCMMHVTSPEKDKGKSLGEATGNSEHVAGHVKEGYLHGSLIMNALRWAGYRQPEFIWQMANSDMARGRKPDQIKRVLKRYLYRQLGLVS